MPPESNLQSCVIKAHAEREKKKGSREGKGEEKGRERERMSGELADAATYARMCQPPQCRLLQRLSFTTHQQTAAAHSHSSTQQQHTFASDTRKKEACYTNMAHTHNTSNQLCRSHVSISGGTVMDEIPSCCINCRRARISIAVVSQGTRQNITIPELATTNCVQLQ